MSLPPRKNSFRGVHSPDHSDSIHFTCVTACPARLQLFAQCAADDMIWDPAVVRVRKEKGVRLRHWNAVARPSPSFLFSFAFERDPYSPPSFFPPSQRGRCRAAMTLSPVQKNEVPVPGPISVTSPPQPLILCVLACNMLQPLHCPRRANFATLIVYSAWTSWLPHDGHRYFARLRGSRPPPPSLSRSFLIPREYTSAMPSQAGLWLCADRETRPFLAPPPPPIDSPRGGHRLSPPLCGGPVDSWGILFLISWISLSGTSEWYKEVLLPRVPDPAPSYACSGTPGGG